MHHYNLSKLITITNEAEVAYQEFLSGIVSDMVFTTLQKPDQPTYSSILRFSFIIAGKFDPSTLQYLSPFMHQHHRVIEDVFTLWMDKFNDPTFPRTASPILEAKEHLLLTIRSLVDNTHGLSDSLPWFDPTDDSPWGTHPTIAVTFVVTYTRLVHTHRILAMVGLCPVSAADEAGTCLSGESILTNFQGYYPLP